MNIADDLVKAFNDGYVQGKADAVVHGEWTDNNACPFCGYQPWFERDIHTLSFCPNCGADLRGESDG